MERLSEKTLVRPIDNSNVDWEGDKHPGQIYLEESAWSYLERAVEDSEFSNRSQFIKTLLAAYRRRKAGEKE